MPLTGIKGISERGEMNYSKNVLAALCVTILALLGCATGPHFYGESVADNTLKSDAAKQITARAKLEVNCRSVDQIETRILKKNPIGTGSTLASRKFGSVDERWVVRLCEKEVPFLVTFTPDGEGGTFFMTSRER